MLIEKPMQRNKTVARAWNKRQKRASRRETFGVVVPMLLNVIVAIVQSWELAVFVAALLAGQVQAHKQALFLFIAACGVRILIDLWQSQAALKAGQAARRQLRREILERLFADGPALLRQHHSAVLGTLLGERVEGLEGYFSRWLPISSSWLVAQWLVVGAVLWVLPKAGIILAACCLLMPVFQAAFGIAAARASRREFLALARLQTRFLDRMRGIAMIVLSGSSENEARVMEHASNDLRQRTMKVLRVAFLTSAATDFAMIAALVTIVVTQSHALLQVSSSTLGNGPQGSGHAAAALFAIFMVPEAFAPVRALAAAYQDRAKGKAMAEAMAELAPPPLENTLEERASDESDNAEQARLSKVSSVKFAEAALSPWGISVAFSHVSYRWAAERREALSEVSFSLPPGGVLILEGPSGAGKSTLLELLIGFVSPQKGDVFLGEVNMRFIAPDDLTPLIAWIGQKPVLFSGSLRDNILFGNPEATDEALKIALVGAGVDAFLPSLPAGLETRIGEGGFGLSGGEAQRVAIARAWLKNAPLLVLDEPTAHLDPKTEADVAQALERLMQGRTAIVATHSPCFRHMKGAKYRRLVQGRLLPEEDRLGESGT